MISGVCSSLFSHFSSRIRLKSVSVVGFFCCSLFIPILALKVYPKGSPNERKSRPKPHQKHDFLDVCKISNSYGSGHSHTTNHKITMEQKYIKDDKLTIKDVVNEVIARLGEKISVRRFVRYQLGEE